MMERRTFITAAAVTPLAGVANADTQTVHEKLVSHKQEFMKLLKETAPEGMYVLDQVFFMGDEVIANAYTPNWDKGKPHAKYNMSKQCWELA